VVGPTASGKSEAAIALCKALGGEAVNFDAFQLYQGLRVGTARPLPAQWQGVKHHMLACHPPDEPISAPQYAAMALPVVESLLRKGKPVVLVGGTGLYLDALLFEKHYAGTQGSIALREELEKLDNQTLHQMLAQKDLVRARALHPGDKRRVIRALEIHAQTGKPPSNLIDEGRPRFRHRLIGLSAPREQLLARIERRAKQMWANGLPEETRFLQRHGLSPDCQAMRAIGYREATAYLAGGLTADKTVEAIVIRTRQYAKRQMTWFRRYTEITWFDASMYESAAARDKAILLRVTQTMEENT